MMFIYYITIFISAFLLFQVQLIISRYLLPWFGGSAHVWNMSMFFFQGILVIGYCYAHIVGKKIKLIKTLLIVHLFLIGLALLVLYCQKVFWGIPLLPNNAVNNFINGAPGIRILAILFISVGGPFFLLSSTSSLIQLWFSNLWPDFSPYRLYALSNVGSLLALLSYPFFTEPLQGLRHQAVNWSLIFIVYAALYAFSLLIFSRNAQRMKTVMSEADETPVFWQRALWIILPALGTIILLATTNRISVEIAVIPLFWVLPMAVYLITFIIAFEGRAYEKGGAIWIGITAIALFLFLLLHFQDYYLLNDFQTIGIYLFLLFTACMHCHGTLYRLKPGHKNLTAFYLSLAVGGMLGGLFVSLAAPVIFKSIQELILGYLGCAIFTLAARFLFSMPAGRLRILRIIGGIVPAVVIVTVMVVEISREEDVLLKNRNFYGTFVVREFSVKVGSGENLVQEKARSLTHGMTIHGSQICSPQYSKMATSYYSDNSGVGFLLEQHPAAKPGPSVKEPFQVGVIGLGAGTIAAYGKPHHIYRFYELDDDVIRLSTGPDPCFRFLTESDARLVQIVKGDARKSIEKEITEGKTHQYDVLIVDAFNGDAIPVHLVTLEAIQLYLKVLKPGGIIAFHISSRTIHLEPLVIRQAIESGLGYLKYASKINRVNMLLLSNTWILVSKDHAILNYLARLRKPDTISPDYKCIRPWTDDYTNTAQLLEIAGQRPFFHLYAAGAE